MDIIGQSPLHLLEQDPGWPKMARESRRHQGHLILFIAATEQSQLATEGHHLRRDASCCWRWPKKRRDLQGIMGETWGLSRNVLAENTFQGGCDWGIIKLLYTSRETLHACNGHQNPRLFSVQKQGLTGNQGGSDTLPVTAGGFFSYFLATLRTHTLQSWHEILAKNSLPSETTLLARFQLPSWISRFPSSCCLSHSFCTSQSLPGNNTKTLYCMWAVLKSSAIPLHRLVDRDSYSGRKYVILNQPGRFMTLLSSSTTNQQIWIMSLCKIHFLGVKEWTHVKPQNSNSNL